MAAAGAMDTTHGLDDSRLALAREGGRLAVAAQGRVAVAWKGPGDRMTTVDTAIQSRIVKEIGNAFPGDGMLAEEEPHATTADREFVWVIDPLDGANNFALGVPCFVVSIGILRAGFAYPGLGPRRKARRADTLPAAHPRAGGSWRVLDGDP